MSASTRAAHLAVGKVLSNSRCVTADTKFFVDGKEIDRAHALELHTADTAKPETASKLDKPGLLKRLFDKVAAQSESFEKKLQRSGVGRKVHGAMMARPEWVSERVTVTAVRPDGSELAFAVRVTDRKLSTVLNAITAGTMLLSWAVPFIGTLIPAASAALAVVAGGIARATGHQAVGQALLGMGKKHALIGLLTAPPVIGGAFTALAVADSVVNTANAKKGVSVADIANLAPPIATGR